MGAHDMISSYISYSPHSRLFWRDFASFGVVFDPRPVGCRGMSLQKLMFEVFGTTGLIGGLGGEGLHEKVLT